MVCLENEQHSVAFDTVPKYCILDSSVDYDGHSVSSKGLLPTVVDIMVIWIKFAFLVHFSSLIPKCQCSLLTSPVWPLPIYLDSWTYHSRFLYNIVPYSIGLYFHPSLIHNCMLFSLWLSLFILSGAISALFSSSILDTYQPGEFTFQCHIFLPFSYCS